MALAFWILVAEWLTWIDATGIGSRTVLEPLEIPVKVDLPGVGENLQDHVYVSSLYEVSNEVETLDVLRGEDRLAAETAL
jgi:hypothetical protein